MNVLDRIIDKLIPDNINGYKYFIYKWSNEKTDSKIC